METLCCMTNIFIVFFLFVLYCFCLFVFWFVYLYELGFNLGSHDCLFVCVSIYPFCKATYK